MLKMVFLKDESFKAFDELFQGFAAALLLKLHFMILVLDFDNISVLLLIRSLLWLFTDIWKRSVRSLPF